MKRSEINRVIKEAMEFIDSMGFKLPPFAFWSPEEWASKGRGADEIRDNMLGWDVTDFGSGDFKRLGLVLFTLRNGNPVKKKYGKTYAEKIMLLSEKQVTPLHYHALKTEDIINRGGGNLAVKFFNLTGAGRLSGRDVTVSMDGITNKIPAGSKIFLSPGGSVCVTPRLCHSFYAEAGDVLAGEISSVNDDRADNFFLEAAGRFPRIEEDEEPCFLLCGEYPRG